MTRDGEKLDRDNFIHHAMSGLDAGVYDSGDLGNHSRGLDEVGGGDLDEVESSLEGARADGLNVGSVVECR